MSRETPGGGGAARELPGAATLRERFLGAERFPEFLEGAGEHREFWGQIHGRARVPAEVLERASRLSRPWHLLALTEAWCADGANTLPYLARLCEACPRLDLRMLRRDENPDLMDAHLTGDTRSIPVVMILDEAYREVAWWGPRPGPLQELFLRELKDLPKPERARRLRSWYVRDRGRTTLLEILSLIPDDPS